MKAGQSPPSKTVIDEDITGDSDSYTTYAASVCERSLGLIGIWLSNSEQAHLQAEFHRQSIDRWRITLSKIEREPKREAAVDPGTESEVAKLSEHQETKLEMARRHVREGEANVARQRKIAAEIPSNGALGNATRRLARQVLAEFEKTLHDHKAHLARLEKRAAA